MNRSGRRPRTHTPNTIHHVMIRGNNRQQIFYTSEYFSRFLELLCESSEKYDHKIIAYCLMSNHAHLLIHVFEAPLSLVMKSINYRYARWCNYKLNRIGHLFQGRFRSIEVNDIHYLVNLCRYIHLNPVSAKMVSSVGEYPWSSHHYYAKNNAPAWMSIDFMCATIKNVTGLNYLDYISRVIGRKNWKPVIYLSDTGQIIYDKTISYAPEGKIETDSIEGLLSENQVIEIFCKHLNVKREELLNASRTREYCKLRVVLAYFLLEYTAMNLSDVATLYMRTHGTLSRQISKFKENSDIFVSQLQMSKIEKALYQMLVK